MLGLAFGLLSIAMKAAKNRAWTERYWGAITGDQKHLNGIILVLAFVFIPGWIGCFTPGYAIPEAFAGYLLRLRPIVIWLTLIGGVALAILSVERFGWHGAEFLSDLRSNKSRSRVSLLSLGFMLFIFGVIAWTGIGVRIREDYWYPAGVPILGLQLWLAFVIGALVWWAGSNKKLGAVIGHDLAICIVLWLVTAYIWANEPLRDSFFLPGPARPNHEFYPFSDAASFDLYSQFALIGQGLVDGLPLDRALYPGFLVYLHALAGQNFELLMVIQAVVYAIFPVIMYLLGSQLHSREAGISAGIVTLLRGTNAIKSSTWLDLANPKMPLTDFPAAICVALAALLIIHWMKAPERNQRSALWAGGIFALAILLRTNALLLVPVVLLYALTVFPRQFRKWALACMLLITAMLVTTLPWDLRNQSKGARMFSLYFERIQVVLETRYPPPPVPTPSPAGSVLDRNYLRRTHPAEAVAWNDPHASAQAGTAVISDLCGSSIACSIYNNYFHNLVTAVLILPTSLELHDLPHIIRNEDSYWQQDWTGQDFSPSAGLLVSMNLMMIALGIGGAWSRVRFPALVPVLFFFVYAASNALGRTSGGRYIVPMDWIVCLFFVVGVFEVFRLASILFGARPDTALPDHQSLGLTSLLNTRKMITRTLSVLITLFTIGSLLPASEWIHPRRYREETAEQVLTRLDGSGLLQQAGVELETLAIFLRTPQARLLTGRGLYPRYYNIGDGEAPNDYPYAMLGFPRLAFSVIGPIPASPNRSTPHGVILPHESMPTFPNSVDVVVLGCQEEVYLDAFVVFVLGEQSSVLVRSPASKLSCPFPQPVCDDNHNCQ